MAALLPGLAVALIGAVGAIVLASPLEGLVPTGLAGRVGADQCAVLAGVVLVAAAIGLLVSSIPAARIARGSVASELRVE